MDRLGRRGGSAEIADDSFHESMARLSVHLATRKPTHELPDPLPPPRHFRVAWPYVLVVAIIGAGAIAYPYYKWLVQDDAPRVVPQHVATATAAPTPVVAAAAVAPEPAPAPPPPAEVQHPAPVDVAAEIPAPPPPEPPVTLPASVGSAAPQAEIALSRSEIVEVQKRLLSLAIDIGRADGIVGPRTTAGARRYEQRVGQPATGKVDRSLLALLRQDPGTASALQARAP